MAPATQQPQRADRSDSGVFRRLELERVLRSVSESELRELVKTGAIVELLDEAPENPLEY